jgi:hypothetical protein
VKETHTNRKTLSIFTAMSAPSAPSPTVSARKLKSFFGTPIAIAAISTDPSDTASSSSASVTNANSSTTTTSVMSGSVSTTNSVKSPHASPPRVLFAATGGPSMAATSSTTTMMMSGNAGGASTSLASPSVQFKHASGVAPCDSRFDSFKLADLALPSMADLASLQRPLWAKLAVILQAAAHWRLFLERLEPTLALFVERTRQMHESRDAFSNVLLRFGRFDASATQTGTPSATAPTTAAATADGDDADVALSSSGKRIPLSRSGSVRARVDECAMQLSPFFHDLGFLCKEIVDQHRTESERLQEQLLRPVRRALEQLQQFDALVALASKHESAYIDALAALMQAKPHDASKGALPRTVKFERLLKESSQAADDLSWALFDCLAKFEELVHDGVLALVPLCIEFVQVQILSLGGERKSRDDALDSVRLQYVAALGVGGGARRNVAELKHQLTAALERASAVGGSRIIGRFDVVAQQGYVFVRRKTSRGFGSSSSAADGLGGAPSGIRTRALSMASSMTEQSEPWRRFWLTLNQRDGTLLFERAYGDAASGDTIVINMLLASVRADSQQSGRRNVFELIDAISQTTFLVQAPDVAEHRNWIKCIQRSVELSMSRQRPRSLSNGDMPEVTAAAAAAAAAAAGAPHDALAQLKRIADVRGNELCAECGAASPDWCVLNQGQLICIDCSGAHRKLGVKVSVVRSLTLDQLDDASIAFLLAARNEAINAYFEAKLPAARESDGARWSGNGRLATRSEQSDRFAFVSAKYLDLRWVPDGASAAPPMFARYASSALVSTNSASASPRNQSPRSTSSPRKSSSRTSSPRDSALPESSSDSSPPKGRRQRKHHHK